MSERAVGTIIFLIVRGYVIHYAQLRIIAFSRSMVANMPDKPTWLNRVAEAIHVLEASPLPWVERSTVEELLGVGRRRAQQILAPLATQRSGHTTIVVRTALVAYFKRIASGETAFYEQQRREKLWQSVEQDRKRWTQTPPVFVEPPAEMVRAVYRRDFEGLPSGVKLSPGRIVIEFATPDEALQKLLALAMAVGQDRHAFDDLVTVTPTS